jgi:hypothetical protein
MRLELSRGFMEALSNPGDALALEVTQDFPSGIVAGRAGDAAKARRSFTPAPSIVSLDSMIRLTGRMDMMA